MRENSPLTVKKLSSFFLLLIMDSFRWDEIKKILMFFVATALVFGCGLIGLAVVGRKKIQQGNIE